VSGITIIPSARRLMTSLRGLPYDLPGAVADLVDNSLDAGARRIDIDLATNWRGPFLRIVDDGHAMTERRLDEAMRYGSARRYGSEDLGHFGLGLKTASLSQCRRLSVASRTTLKSRVRVRRWDLDRVAAEDAWVLERPRLLDCRPELTAPLRDATGTVVLWEKLDRILGGRRSDSEAGQRRLESASDDVLRHLAMVFHRFLTGEGEATRVTITLNGAELEPWDPFARSEPMTQRLRAQTLALRFAGNVHDVRLTPYVLPPQHHFSGPEAHALAAGPKRWNRQQGLYIYRRNRLIQAGGWNRLRTLDEHSKLARIALEMPAGADGAFRTDVAKMHVGLPEDFRPGLRVLIAGVVSKAQETYRQRVRAVPDAGPSDGAHGVPDGTGLVLGDQWPMISAVLERELAEHPELLDRVLLALINARPAPYTEAHAETSRG
jgi:hypothetical protein